MVLAAFAGALALAVWLWKRWKKLRFTGYSPGLIHTDKTRRAIFAQYRKAQRTLRSYRAPEQTVQEHAGVTPDIAELASLVDIAAYRPEAPDAGMVERAKLIKPQKKT
jgi:hypothetical protein